MLIRNQCGISRDLRLGIPNLGVKQGDLVINVAFLLNHLLHFGVVIQSLLFQLSLLGLQFLILRLQRIDLGLDLI